MNQAHFHLLTNHLPIVGLVIGVLTLIVGLLLKKSQVKLTALGILIFSALASIAAFYTGEGAEEIVEQYAGVSEKLIHDHEEHAELFFTLILILGGLSLIAFVMELRKLKSAKYIIIVTLLLALADGVVAKYVGTSGGEIRHIEIREDAPTNSNNYDEPEENDDD